MHIRELEKRYDVVFFHRSSTGVKPTETGRQFYKAAISVLGVAKTAEDKLRELSGVLSEHLTIGVMPAFARAVLCSALLRCAEEQKHVRVSVIEAYSGQLAEDVVEGKLDFAVVPLFNSDLDLTTTRMGIDQECLVCSAQTNLNLKSEAILSDLPPLRLIMPSKANVRRPLIEHYVSVNNIKLEETMELDTMLGTLDVVAKSDWVSVLPAVLSPPDKDGRDRLFTPLAQPSLEVEYVRITHKARPLSSAGQAFADVLQQELNNVLESDPLGAR